MVNAKLNVARLNASVLSTTFEIVDNVARINIGRLNAFRLQLIIGTEIQYPTEVLQGQYMVSASKNIPVQLFSAARSGTSIPIAIPVSCTKVNIHLRGNAIPSGNLLVEESLDPNDPFTWSVVQTIDMSQIGDNVEQVIHLVGLFTIIRLRIPVALVGSNAMSATIICS